MLLTRYGIREWMTATVVAAIAIAVLGSMDRWWETAVPGLLWLGIVWFFRDPPRRVPTDLPQGTMLSPADGTVTAVQHVEDHPAVGGPAVVIRIFLSMLNVHVNRSPADGRVVDVKYVRGRFLDARTAASATENESNLITIELDGAETIGVRQIAGKVARRIVCDLRPGDRLRRGGRFGMIKFGSGTELILPRRDDVVVHVRVGDRVKAGLTPLVATVAAHHSLTKLPMASAAV